jgi:hypothetical protein
MNGRPVNGQGIILIDQNSPFLNEFNFTLSVDCQLANSIEGEIGRIREKAILNWFERSPSRHGK